MSRLREQLLERLREQFGSDAFRIGNDPNVIAVFPARHEDVGDVVLWDDEDEVQLSVEGITHGHFASYDSGASTAAATQETVSDVIEFLRLLFADKVLLWRTKRGGVGGWRVLDVNEKPMPGNWLKRHFVWSGPVRR